MLFKKAEATNAYLKCGILGFAGSGKTFTAYKITTGLHKYIESKSPVYFLDTETGSDFLLKKFEAEKIELQVAKSRAFIDLLEGVDEAERQGSILIIDSITHYWNDLMDSFCKKKQIKRVMFQHWKAIKDEWKVYTDKFINSKCHIIMCGRAGWEYDFEEDSEGVKELVKTGTRMKAETEMGYEPSLLIEMEKVKKEGEKIGGSLIHRAWVLKDRFDMVNGLFFDNPAFESFLPHIELLNLKGIHLGVETGDSQSLFNSGKSVSEMYKQKDIFLEEIQAELAVKFGRTDESKKAKIQALKQIFGSPSWTAIEEKSVNELEMGLQTLKQMEVKNGSGA